MLLHDGSKIIATRYISYKGRHEIGQPVPIGESTISFKLPNTNKTISWTSEYAEDLGHTNFLLLALHMEDNTPYIVAYPLGCTSYNKWGRRNPPYVYFKYDGTQWQRIRLTDFPAVFKTINVYVSHDPREVKMLVKNSPISAQYIKEKNNELVNYPEFQTILKEHMQRGNNVSCKVLVRIEGGWATPSHVETMRKSKILREKELERRSKAAEVSDKK